MADAPVPGFTYRANVVRVIDADTLEVIIDLGIRVFMRLPLRLAHVDAPEHGTDAGKMAIATVTLLLGQLPRPVVPPRSSTSPFRQAARSSQA